MNPGTKGYLRALSSEFGESTNSVRVELNRLSKDKLLLSENKGRTIEYCANTNHSLFNEIKSIVQKYAGVDKIIDKLVKRLGEVRSAYLIGDYANGIDSGLIDILLVGDIKINILNNIVEKRSKEIKRKIRPLVLDEKELGQLWDQLEMENALLIWGKPIK